MSDLTEFLRARLDEEAVRAGKATRGPWRADLDEDLVLAGDDVIARMWDFNRAGTAVQCAADTMLVTVHADPVRVLAEIEAKREVVRLAERAHDYHETFMNGFSAAMEEALRLFALPYAAHPDYQPEWAPGRIGT